MLTIDLDGYRTLPFDVRSEFDAWLRVEKLDKAHAVFLALGERAVTIECYEVIEIRPGVYRPVLGPDGAVKMVRKTVPVSTVPPAAAFAWEVGSDVE